MKTLSDFNLGAGHDALYAWICSIGFGVELTSNCAAACVPDNSFYARRIRLGHRRR
jgi:hypothetical protein